MLFEKQKFQEDCIQNIIKVLEHAGNVSNNDFSNLEKSLKDYCKKNGYMNKFSYNNQKKLDILMETGTGKTFAYIGTIFEINKYFGNTRFIIIVPRTSIRFGVMQHIRQTDSYFFSKYNKHLNVITYAKKKDLSKIVNEFLSNDRTISILLLTNSAFNKDTNIVNSICESGSLFANGSIWDNIAKKNPIVIIDEPHLLKGKKTTEYLGKITSLLIRFGATYPKNCEYSLSNVVYALDSKSAFNQYLVKKISVYTVMTDEENSGYQLVSTEPRKKQFTLFYCLNQDFRREIIKTQQDIGQLTGMTIFKGFVCTEIKKDVVYLKDVAGNTKELKREQGLELGDQEIRSMIKKTIERHFEKEQKNFNSNIKTLSLFFIANIDDFRGNNPKIKKIFEEEYRKYKKDIYQLASSDYKAYLDLDNNSKTGELSVHEGYFSGDQGSKEEQEASGVDAILNDKEALLSLKGKFSNLRFIFSVWALQEGWDNPNIFNICKLSNTTQENSKRQQVGRGLRIAVKENGQRLTFTYMNENEQDFYAINTLDMVVSHRELNFINSLQEEIQDVSLSIVGDCISHSLLKEKGLTDTEATEILSLLSSEKIVELNTMLNEYEIKSDIGIFLRNNIDKIHSMSEVRLEYIITTIFSGYLKIQNGNKPIKKIGIRKCKLDKFKELWETINKNSILMYNNIKKDTLVEIITNKFNQERIDPIKIKIRQETYDPQNNRIIDRKDNITEQTAQFFTLNQYPEFIQTFIKDERVKLPIQFIIEIMNKLDINKIKNNPNKAKKRLKAIIKDTLHVSLVNAVKYKFSKEKNIKTSMHNKISGQYLDSIESTQLGRHWEDKKIDALLYDSIVYDSQIEKKLQMQQSQEVNSKKIIVFAKLPRISIPTPYKTYSPDFAYLFAQKKEKLFLVLESKGYKNECDIPRLERIKIDYAKKFFVQLNKKIDDITLRFEVLTSNQNLSDIL